MVFKNIALILSGGEGKRFDKNIPKQFFKLNKSSILEITVKKFLKSKLFQKIIVVGNKKFNKQTKEILQNCDIHLIDGGKTRQMSVYNGLKFSKKFNPKNIVIHDSVRPFFSNNLLKESIKFLNNYDCTIPFLNIYDSIRRLQSKNIENVDRDKLKLVQTPQGFNYGKIYESHIKYKNLNFTDDSMMAYYNGCKIKFIKGEISNFKITEKKDLEYTKKLLDYNENNMRIGNGFDVHKFTDGNLLTLLGVKIPFKRKLEGHSDADVGIHSIVDSLLGAISEGDIGNHFPPTEKKWKNKNSEYFLEYTKKLIDSQNYKINNIDITIICEEPKISNFKEKMRKKISKILKIDINKINIKGTTTEKLGFLGRKEGIACQTISLISKIDEF